MPFIKSDFIAQLCEQINIVDIIAKNINLKKIGRNYKACCPFHKEKTPSFSVNIDKQIYKCFGCGIGGDVIKFTQDYYRLDYVGAVEKLAADANISVIYDKKVNTDIIHKKDKYKDIMDKVNNYFYNQLQKNLSNKVGIYLKQRGLSKEIIDKFQIGYAPKGFNNLANYFTNDKKIITQLIEMGLVIKGEKNNYYDRFRERLMFPITDYRNNIIAFGGRTLANDKAKYINSPETVLFSKSKHLYGLAKCLQIVGSIGFILVVEGYMDVIALHQHNIQNVVATLGTATTDFHIQTLARYTQNIIFCFDGDNAGKKAALHAMEVSLKNMYKIINIKFLFLEQNHDPDTLVNLVGKDKFLVKVESAMSLSNFLFNSNKNKFGIKNAEQKSIFIQEVFKFIKQVPNDIYLEQLLLDLAQFIKQDASYIKTLFKNNNKKNSIKNSFNKENIKSPNTNANKKLMSYAIKLLLHYPVIADAIDLAKVKQINNSDDLYFLVSECQNNQSITKDELLLLFNGKKKARVEQLLKEDIIEGISLIKKDLLATVDKLLVLKEKEETRLKIKKLSNNDLDFSKKEEIKKAIDRQKNL